MQSQQDLVEKEKKLEETLQELKAEIKSVCNFLKGNFQQINKYSSRNEQIKSSELFSWNSLKP